MSGENDSKNRLIDVVLDSDSFGRAAPDIEHERAVAVFDLIEENSFHPVGDAGGPYKLNLSLVEKRLVFNITRDDDSPVMTHVLSLTPFKRVIKDYFMIGESSYEAIRISSPVQVDARTEATPCPLCQGRLQLDEHAAETFEGERIRVARCHCVECGTSREIYFHLKSTLQS